MFFKKLIIFSFCLISGCGFSPLYKAQDNGTITALTSQIEVSPIQNYEGYILQSQLVDKLNPEKIGGAKKYVLNVTLNAPTYTDQSIQGDAFASREKIIMTAKYTLTDKKNHKLLLKSSARVTGSYNVVKQPYATTIARDNVRKNLVDILSDKISLHMITYFKGLELKKEEEQSAHES